MSTKPFIFVVGATGNTGRAITKSLLEDGGFRVGTLVRPKSVDNPIVQGWKDAGVEIRTGDIEEAPERIESFLKDVDILISLVSVISVNQKPLLLAAKKVGVGRLIPSDFGPSAPRGVMTMHDMKLNTRELVKTLGISYTFIEVGWWLQQMFPWPHAQEDSIFTPKIYFGDQQTKLLYTSLESIGRFVARIVSDPRTINQTVVTSDGEASIADTWAIASKLTGEDFSDYPRIPDEAIEQGVKDANVGVRIMSEYANSLYIRGDNRLEYAVERGALDGRKLYPDLPVVTIEEGAKDFYATLPVQYYDQEYLDRLNFDW